MRRFIFIALCFSLVLSAHKAQASKIEKAYAALSIYDYFKAKKLFYTLLRKNKSGAAFGLATIYYRNDNPFHNPDSAYKYADLCTQDFALLKPDQKKQLKKFGVDDSSVKRLKDSVCLRSYELLLKKSKRSNQEMIERFMQFQQHSPYLQAATDMRDSLVFAAAFSVNSSSAYREFILAYPESKPVPQAKRLLEKALFDENTASHLPADYEKFMRDFPNSTYKDEAENGIFSYYQQKKNVLGLYNFVKKYPHNANVATAWKLVYSLSVPEYQPEALTSFLEKYPEFPYKESIRQEIALLNLQLYSIKENNKFGFIDSAGTLYVPCSFDGAEDFSEGLSAAELDGKFGFIGKTGATSIPFQFEDAESFRNGLAIVQHEGKAAVIDHTGNIVAGGYDDISDFNEGIAIIVKDKLQGAISKTGQLLIAFQYDKIGDFSGQIAYVLKNGKYGYIDPQGDLLIANMFEWAETFRNGMARVKYNNKFGVINTKGDFLLKPEYDRIEEPVGNIFVVSKGNSYGFADKSGCLLSELKYTYSSRLKTTDLTDGKWLRLIMEDYQDLAEADGKKLSGSEDYEEMYLPENGLVRVFTGDKYGYLDERNKTVIKPAYDEASDFNEGIAIARKKENWLLIDKAGKTVYTAKVEEMEDLGGGVYIVSNNGQKGLIDHNGKTLLETEFTNIERINDFLLRTERNSKSAIYNTNTKGFIWQEP